MTYIWNIYETADDVCTAADPFDIFLYSIRKDEAPLANDVIHIEGQRRRIIAIMPDHRRNEVNAFADERYFKVCVR